MVMRGVESNIVNNGSMMRVNSVRLDNVFRFFVCTYVPTTMSAQFEALRYQLQTIPDANSRILRASNQLVLLVWVPVQTISFLGVSSKLNLRTGL